MAFGGILDRDWSVLARLKRRFLLEHVRQLDPGQRLALAAKLRKWALLSAPETAVNAQHRRADLDSHIRVRAALERAARAG